mmetsp:Transcript_37673/g.74065  ORF Transcript_37673/g.74065 Transcript_37673/m.74065 type:complete len:184 (+) Transcript_37673:640-1191(+)
MRTHATQTRETRTGGIREYSFIHSFIHAYIHSSIHYLTEKSQKAPAIRKGAGWKTSPFFPLPYGTAQPDRLTCGAGNEERKKQNSKGNKRRLSIAVLVHGNRGKIKKSAFFIPVCFLLSAMCMSCLSARRSSSRSRTTKKGGKEKQVGTPAFHRHGQQLERSQRTHSKEDRAGKKAFTTDTVR